MGHSQFDPAMQIRPAWNAGKTVGTKRPLTQKQIWAVRFFLDREGRVRDKALFDLAIDSKLRGCDLVKIKIADLVSGAAIRQGDRDPAEDGANLRAIQILLGHTKIENIVRYLGVDIEDALILAERTEI